MLKIVLYTSLSLAAMALTGSLGGPQQATFKRTELQRGDLAISGREAVQSLAEIPSGVGSGRHTHPGEEVGYILEGTVVMEIEGKPSVPLKAGDVFLIPTGRIHNARNIGTETSKMLSMDIVEKGKPLASLIPLRWTGGQQPVPLAGPSAAARRPAQGGSACAWVAPAHRSAATLI